jgi:protein gp37
MSSASAIEWTDTTWNPVTGCDMVSAGCGLPRDVDNDGDPTGGCYALAMAKRLKAMGSAKYQQDGDPRTSGPGFAVTMHPDVLTEPLHWRQPRRVFVNSMSDLFHPRVSDDFIARAFAVMQLAERHTFQVLTKRSPRMRSLLSNPEFLTHVDDHRARIAPGCGDFTWPLPNVWLGVSAEDQLHSDRRISDLRRTPAAVRFVSAEPLLGPLDLTRHLAPHTTTAWTPRHLRDTAQKRVLAQHVRAAARRLGDHYIDWVITGGESGPAARPMHPAWARALRDQCEAADVAFFFKQRGEWSWDMPGADPWLEPDLYVNEATGETGDEAAAIDALGSWQGVWRVGKKRAGRMLDGRTHDDFPEVNSDISL